jgi:hypothetical protein
MLPGGLAASLLVMTMSSARRVEGPWRGRETQGPRSGKIRVDLSLNELLHLGWLVHSRVAAYDHELSQLRN